MIIASLLTLMSSCMALPGQPPLSAQEKGFFKQIQHSCKCKVEKQISVKRKSFSQSEKLYDWYNVSLHYLPYQSASASKRDSLKTVADQLIGTLHKKIIKGENYQNTLSCFGSEKTRAFTQL